MNPGDDVFANFQTGANITNSPHQSENGKETGKPNPGDHPCRPATIHAAFLRLLRSTGIGAFPQNY